MRFVGPGSLLEASSPLLVVLCVRSAPALGYVLLGRGFSPRHRTVAALALALLVGVTTHRFGALAFGTLCGIAYYALVTVAFHALVPATGEKRITRSALFTLAVALYLVVPSIALPGFAFMTFLVLGFEATLSAYSYCVEQARARTRATLKECLFFVLVDPTCSYMDRSRLIGCAAFHAKGALRVVLGAAGLSVGMAILNPLNDLIGASQHLAASGTYALGPVALYGATQFLAEYVKHSSLARLQIGLMRQLGYLTPEAYVYPLAARTPMEFWQRWNTFVGNWIRRYVFVPASLGVGRALRGRTPLWGKASGVLGAFVAAGALHTGYAYIGSFQVNLHWVEWFALHGLLILAWVAVTELARRLEWRAFSAPLTGTLARLAFLALLELSLMHFSA